MKAHPYLSDLLDETRRFVRRHVVVGEHELNAIAVWNAHTYVYDVAFATPYLHPHSPEPSSGKTTLLDVLSVTACNAIQVDNMSEAVLFRLIESRHPTLLIDEADSVFKKKNSDSAEAIRQVLNSGYVKGKKAWRCVPPSHEAKGFDVYCPKATAGLHELPGTLASRSIPLGMRPPLPSDAYEDFDPEEAAGEAEALRINLQSWAEESLRVLADPQLKPARLPQLDARGNQIWRILFRIADQAEGDWSELIRVTAVELSGTNRRHRDASAGVRLLGHIRDVFDGERMFCGALASALNELEDAPYGGWNDGKGITTRELGKKLAPYLILAKAIRIGDNRAKGYERDQFEDAWSRYLPLYGDSNSDTVTTRSWSQKSAKTNSDTEPLVTLSRNSDNPHEQSDVTVVTVSKAGYGEGRPLEVVQQAPEVVRGGSSGDEMHPTEGVVPPGGDIGEDEIERLAELSREAQRPRLS